MFECMGKNVMMHVHRMSGLCMHEVECTTVCMYVCTTVCMNVCIKTQRIHCSSFLPLTESLCRGLLFTVHRNGSVSPIHMTVSTYRNTSILPDKATSSFPLAYSYM